MAHHEGLGKRLAPLQLRCGLGGPGYRPAGGCEHVGHAVAQRHLRADYRQVDPLGLGQREDRFGPADVDRCQAADGRHPWVAGGTHHGLDPRLAGQCPRQRVLAAAAAENEDLH